MIESRFIITGKASEKSAAIFNERRINAIIAGREVHECRRRRRRRRSSPSLASEERSSAGCASDARHFFP